MTIVCKVIVFIILCLFLLLTFYCVFLNNTLTSDDQRGHFLCGIIYVILFVYACTLGVELFNGHKKYFGRYDVKSKDVTELFVDTTFVVNKNNTDTIYTLYYNQKD